jgi:hypothetical protein
MGNYVIAVGKYVIVSPSELGNYMIADSHALAFESRKTDRLRRRPRRRATFAAADLT